jgi:hypothetical protein
MRKFSIGSVNMQRRNAVMHVLLATNEDDDILLVQEPWFNPVGTARCDSMIDGKDILGGATNPQWDIHYPYFNFDQRTKVMTYARIHERGEPFRRNRLQMVSRNDLVSHPCILLTEVKAGRETWCVLNFYNDVDDPTALRTLLGLDLDPLIPTLLTGDFNLHSFTWSLMGWAPDQKAADLEEWAATQTLSLLSQPSIPTHRGENGACSSTIDLTWLNLAATVQGIFQGAHIHWDGSVNSDHALIRTFACTWFDVVRPPSDHTNGFDMNLSPEDWETWLELFKDAVPRVRGPLRSAAEVDAIVDLLYLAFNSACTAVMKRKGSAPAHNSCWWSPACADAARAVQQAPTQALKDEATRALKVTVRNAKRTWADNYITTANVWEVAAWRHGRRQTHIPALVDANGTLTFNHDSMSTIFADRFFAWDLGDIPLSFPDDPPTQPVRPFAPITADEAFALLSRASNTSSPGDLGIGWALLKKGWGPASETLTAVFNACITLGHHPAVWKNAVVVVIPKPDWPDYTQAKAHRPISLLETMSKLLEKVVAQRIQHDIVTEELIPTTQFGGRKHSSCLDTGLTLLHDVQAAHSAGLKCGIMLFDVKGFFDHVNHARLVQVVRQMGFAPEMCGWMSSFLRDRKVSLRFNNLLASKRDQPVGVPQGSPISPVLSVAYTSSLLHKMGSWTNSSLGMYVDDSILFACADTWVAVQDTLQSQYAICEEWLRWVGLSAELDKTELLYFQKPFECNSVPAPHSITLPCTGSTYEVHAVETLRYSSIVDSSGSPMSVSCATRPAHPSRRSWCSATPSTACLWRTGGSCLTLCACP